MKKLIALFCIFAMILTACGCSTTSVETTVISTFDGENAVTNSTVINDSTVQNGDITQNSNSTVQNGSTTQNGNSTVQNGSTIQNSSSTAQNGSTTQNSNSTVQNGSTTQNGNSTVQSGSTTQNGNSTVQNGSTTQNGNSTVQNGSTTQNGNSTVQSGSTTQNGNSTVQNGSTIQNSSSIAQNGSTTQNSSSTVQNGSTTQNSSSTVQNGDTNVNTGTNSVIDNPLKPDLKGATIVIYDSRDTFFADTTVSKAQQARSQMLTRLQKELNCKFDVKKVDDSKLITLTATSASAGKPIGGIITTTLYSSGTYISSNLVANLCKVSSLDLSKDYMNRGDVLNTTGFGNGKYGVAYDSQSSTHCVFYNKRILNELGYANDYIYNLVDKGEWTISIYRKLAKESMKDLDGKPGMAENDQWGQAIQDASSAFAPNILASMGVKKIKLVNGKLVLNMSDPQIMKGLDLARDVITNDGTYYTEVRGDKAIDFFSKGNTLFLYASGIKANLLGKMQDEFGLVPAPKVDGAKDYTTAVDGNVGTMMIPAGLSAQDQYNAGAVVQAYNYLFSDVLEVQKNEYVNRYFCDEKSGENWLVAIKNVSTEPTQCYSRLSEAILSGTERVFWDYIEKGTSPATAIESTKVATQKALDELNGKIKDQ